MIITEKRDIFWKANTERSSKINNKPTTDIYSAYIRLVWSYQLAYYYTAHRLFNCLEQIQWQTLYNEGSLEWNKTSFDVLDTKKNITMKVVWITTSCKYLRLQS